MDPLVAPGARVDEEVLFRVPVHCSLRSRQAVDVRAGTGLISRHAQGEVLWKKVGEYGRCEETGGGGGGYSGAL